MGQAGGTTRSSRRRSKYVSTKTKAFKIHPIAGTDGRSPWDTIGRYGMRNFMLDKKSETLMSIKNDGASAACEAEKAVGNWHITSISHKESICLCSWGHFTAKRRR
ncbi:hypothetical protein QQ045_019282 [Rhodiola kirilowii]